MKSQDTATEVAVEMGTGNVYADLGYSSADSMLIKAQLVTKIGDIVRERGLTQVEAAKTLGLTQPKVSKLLKGQFRGISEQKLLECLTRLGKDVQITIRRAARNGAGRLAVRFA